MTPSDPGASNGWTGGQYSLYRTAFGIWLFLASAAQFDGSDDWLWITVEILIIPLVLGFKDRAFAVSLVVLLLVIAYAAGTVTPPFVAVLWLLFAHLGVPAAPYGSLDAIGRPDPGNGWHVPQINIRANWLVLSAIYAYDGGVRLIANHAASDNVFSLPASEVSTAVTALMWIVGGFEVAFLAIAASARLRPALWIVMLVVQLAVLVVRGQSLFDGGLVALHLLLFDPAWIAPDERDATDEVFYDGSCGLCHRAVRFILAEDRLCTAFRFAPLGGEVFLTSLSESQRVGLPDSVALLSADGRLLTRSAAVVRILLRLGGIWKLVGSVAQALPPNLLDGAYDAVARVRYRLFARPKDACPIIPKYLRTRFDG